MNKSILGTAEFTTDRTNMSVLYFPSKDPTNDFQEFLSSNTDKNIVFYSDLTKGIGVIQSEISTQKKGITYFIEYYFK